MNPYAKFSIYFWQYASVWLLLMTVFTALMFMRTFWILCLAYKTRKTSWKSFCFRTVVILLSRFCCGRCWMNFVYPRLKYYGIFITSIQYIMKNSSDDIKHNPASVYIQGKALVTISCIFQSLLLQIKHFICIEIPQWDTTHHIWNNRVIVVPSKCDGCVFLCLYSLHIVIFHILLVF